MLRLIFDQNSLPFADMWRTRQSGDKFCASFSRAKRRCSFFQCLNPTLARWCPEIVEHQHRSLSVGTIRPAPTFGEQWVACCSRARWPTGATEILANHPVAGLTVLRIAQKSQKSDPARCWARPTKTLAHKAKNHSILDNVKEN